MQAVVKLLPHYRINNLTFCTFHTPCPFLTTFTAPIAKKKKYLRKIKVCCLLEAGFSPGLLFTSEDGSNVFLRNVGSLSPDYTVFYPTRQNSS
jgi:hypothetical protein